MAKTVLVAIADGIEELEAITIVDVLRRAGAEVTVASVGPLQVMASRGVKLTADQGIGDCAGQAVYDLIALPGGLPGAEYLRDCGPLIEMLRQQKAAGRLVAAICASPAVVLAHHGLIDDRKTTCYPAMLDKLPQQAEGRVVVDGNCITSQGPATALEFSLVLVELLCGKPKADEVGSGMLAGCS